MTRQVFFVVFFSNSAIEFKGGPGRSALSVGKSHARNPIKNPTPNQAEPHEHTLTYEDSVPPLASALARGPWCCVFCVVGRMVVLTAWRATHSTAKHSSEQRATHGTTTTNGDFAASYFIHFLSLSLLFSSINPSLTAH